MFLHDMIYSLILHTFGASCDSSTYMLCIPVLATQSYLEVDRTVTVSANNAVKSRTAFEALGLPIAPTKVELDFRVSFLLIRPDCAKLITLIKLYQFKISKIGMISTISQMKPS
jgi:hypothetical protein